MLLVDPDADSVSLPSLSGIKSAQLLMPRLFTARFKLKPFISAAPTTTSRRKISGSTRTPRLALSKLAMGSSPKPGALPRLDLPTPTASQGNISSDMSPSISRSRPVCFLTELDISSRKSLESKKMNSAAAAKMNSATKPPAIHTKYLILRVISTPH